MADEAVAEQGENYIWFFAISTRKDCLPDLYLLQILTINSSHQHAIIHKLNPQLLTSKIPDMILQLKKQAAITNREVCWYKSMLALANRIYYLYGRGGARLRDLICFCLRLHLCLFTDSSLYEKKWSRSKTTLPYPEIPCSTRYAKLWTGGSAIRLGKSRF